MKSTILSLPFLLAAGALAASAEPASAPRLAADAVRGETARPLAPGAAERLMAFGRALALVRYFHPADTVASADWDALAREGVQIAEAATTPAALRTGLGQLLAPIAPGLGWEGVRVDEAPAPPLAAYLVAQRHRGYGQNEQFYRSWREYLPAQGPVPHYRAALGAGLELDLPLAVYADAARHTLPPQPAGAPAAGTPFQYHGNDRATRLADTLQAWAALYYFFPYADEVALDWDALLRTSLAAAATDRDEKAFTHTLARMASALRDGHARASGPREADYFAPALPVRFVGGHAIAGPSRLPVPAGSELTAIDGQALAQVLDRIAQEFTAPSASMQVKLNETELLAGLNGTQLDLSFTTPDGQDKVVKLVRDTRLSEVAPPPALAPIAELEPGTWYVDLDRASDDMIAARMTQLARAKAIIFDVRRYIEPGIRFLGHLSDVPLGGPRTDIAHIASPERASWQWESLRMKIMPARPRLGGKRYFLIGGHTISAAETFMEIVRSHKLGTIVGAPTAGTSGDETSIKLAGGYKLRWTGLRFLRDDGGRFHGIGIAPDVPVLATREGVAQGKDEVLAAALSLARAANKKAEP